ncbi:hypothetical protein F3Y22_tig00112523pilonHSYRG00279 [Hibiscus syriacus]|uniref:Uncharacterized protein n=1 Tax=Hibiscus syriacus TaxID=106335 RepID=A0A6A2WW85_HIBSY|nr:uncharacterized protein LOC120181290 [Hibiscus syriacus]KAE8666003.1 hypothetical protein F3Y22_tig00112523pilonHSYRG00279 [Hibiscus syriacus]
MATEDFSFPKITNPSPQFTSLPSLWSVSSLIYPEFEFEFEEEEPASLQRKSFSNPASSESEANKRDPEEMDVLWEEFNEELKRAASLRSRREVQAMEKMTETGYGTELIGRKKQSKSLLTVMKRLKIKLFYIRNFWIKN